MPIALLVKIAISVAVLFKTTNFYTFTYVYWCFLPHGNNENIDFDNDRQEMFSCDAFSVWGSNEISVYDD